MGKKTLVLITALFFLLLAKPAHSAPVGGSSAVLASSVSGTLVSVIDDEELEFQIKRRVIRKLLTKYNSPMADSTDAFIEACRTYDLDCYLLPSIAGVESTYGKFIYPNSYNAFGWGRGLIMFETWDEGILTVGEKLRTRYIDRGAETIDQIGAIYCEGNTWAGKVKSIKGQFEREEAKMRLYFSLNTVEL